MKGRWLRRLYAQRIGVKEGKVKSQRMVKKNFSEKLPVIINKDSGTKGGAFPGTPGVHLVFFIRILIIGIGTEFHILDVFL